jgi:hypothetical protein
MMSLLTSCVNVTRNPVCAKLEVVVIEEGDKLTRKTAEAIARNKMAIIQECTEYNRFRILGGHQ